jgi:hypothetical protein
MLKDQKGSPDGITIVEYKSGIEYDVSPDLRNSFVKKIRCAIDKKLPIIAEIKKKLNIPDRKKIEKEIEKIDKDLKNNEKEINVKSVNVLKNKGIKTTPKNKGKK